MSTPELKIKDGQFKDIFDPIWLRQLDHRFLQQLHAYNSTLHNDLLAYRQQNREFSALAVSALLLACAPVLEQHLAELFHIESAVLAPPTRLYRINLYLLLNNGMYNVRLDAAC